MLTISTEPAIAVRPTLDLMQTTINWIVLLIPKQIDQVLHILMAQIKRYCTFLMRQVMDRNYDAALPFTAVRKHAWIVRVHNLPGSPSELWGAFTCTDHALDPVE